MAAEAEGQGTRRYRCRVCGATRSKRSLIVQHMQRLHPAALSDFCVVGKDRRRYECAICGDSRSKLSLLRKHIYDVHSPPLQMNDVSDTTEASRPTPGCRKRKLHECMECGRQVKKASHLDQHLITHSLQGDFEEEDLKFQAQPRGGRKPATLQKVEDLFRKRVVGPKEEENTSKQGG